MVHADWSIQISEVLVICKATMGDKSVETLGSKIKLLSILVTFSTLPPRNKVDFSISLTTQLTALTQH